MGLPGVLGSSGTSGTSGSSGTTGTSGSSGTSGASITINNNTDNFVLTGTGTANTINGETNLRFDGSNFSLGLTTFPQRFALSGSLIIGSGSLGVGVNPNATQGRIDALNDIVAFSSDRRLKENVEVIHESMEKIKRLLGVTYTWNALANKLAKYETSSRYVGIFAQDVQMVLPEAVKLAPFDNDGYDNSLSGQQYLTVQYEKLIPLLIEGLKEQQRQLDTIQQQVDKLQRQISNEGTK
jgi:hypothetical protein